MDRRLRSVEFVRFALLLTLTIALIDVAGRIGDHPTAARHQATGPVNSGTPTPGASGPTTTPGTHHRGRGAHAGGGTPSSTATPPAAGGSSTGGSGTSTGSSTGTSTGTPPGTEPVAATLPRSGTAVADLAGLSTLLLAAGAFTLGASRPRA